MRLIKMFGLAALAAVLAMAFVGASSAMATSTVLCTVDNEEPCTNHAYTGHIEALAVTPELLSNLADVSCDHSVILGNALGLATAPNGTAQLTHLELIDFTGCETLVTHIPCTVTAEELGLVDLLKTGANTGLVTSLGSKVAVVCGTVINCTFGGEPDGTAVGASLPLSTSSLGTITVSDSTLTRSGMLCPAVGKWDAKYKILLPHEIFIAQ